MINKKELIARTNEVRDYKVKLEADRIEQEKNKLENDRLKKIEYFKSSTISYMEVKIKEAADKGERSYTYQNGEDFLPECKEIIQKCFHDLNPTF
jgi:hypothetical protein